jgi:multidrug resistance protein, MATE family
MTHSLASAAPAPAPALPSRSRRVLTEVRALWHLAWPILIGQLATIGMSVTDVAMAGHASAQDLAGVSLGVSIWNMTILTLMGLLMSVSPVVAQQVGAGQFDAVPHVVRQGLWKALLVGLLAFCVANLGALVFEGMALEPRVREVAQGFVHISSWSLPAFACYRVLYGYSTSINQTRPMMVIAVLALLLNALINWLLVFGNAGFAAMGGLGCAWSTMLCVWFHLLALLLWMRLAPAYRRTWPFDRYEDPAWATLRSLFGLGLPIGVTYFAETSAFSLIALLIAKFGSTQVAAHAIALNFTSLTFMLPLSLGLALLSRVGHSLGAGEPAVARFRAWVGVGLTLVFSLLSALGIALWRAPIAQAYTSDPQVAALAAQLLLFAALFQLSDCSQVVSSCAIRAYKVTRGPMLLHLAAFWGVSLPLGCLLGLAPQSMAFAPAQPMAAQGFWIALIVGLTVAASGLLLLLRRVARQHLLLPSRA